MEPVVIGEIVAGSCCYFLVECKCSRDVYKLDARGASCLVCQHHYTVEENFRGMVVNLWVGEWT